MPNRRAPATFASPDARHRCHSRSAHTCPPTLVGRQHVGSSRSGCAHFDTRRHPLHSDSTTDSGLEKH
eukprot:29205-Prymnesium_polylepis.1